MAGFYDREKMWDKAAPLYERVRELDPKANRVDSQLAMVLEKLGKPAGALDALFRYLRKPEAAQGIASGNATILRLADAAKEDERVAKVLAEKPDDEECLYRAALLALFRKRYDEAIQRFEALEKKNPDDSVVVAALRAASLGSQRNADAIRHGERLFELMERLNTVGREYGWQSTIRAQNAALMLREGRLDDAKKLWSMPNYLRLRDVNGWNYTYYNSPADGGNLGTQLKSHRMYRDALPALEQEAMRRGSLGWELLAIPERPLFRG